MSDRNTGEERRKFRRIPVDFPASYEIHGTTVYGWALNACNEGMLVESFMSLDMALHLLDRLRKEGGKPLFLEFTHRGPHRAEAEMKHFHLHFLGRRLCRSQLGFFMPKIQ